MATDLHKAARYGDVAALRRLLDGGAAIEAEDNGGKTPLHFAASNGQTECAALLLDRGAAIEAKDNYGGTPLHYAAVEGQTECAALLLDRGAAIEAEDLDGDTPLHRAAYNGHTECAALLLDRGAAIEAKNNDGWTPLHCAAAEGQTECAALLLDRSAAMEAKSKDGKTPLDLARNDYMHPRLRERSTQPPAAPAPPPPAAPAPAAAPPSPPPPCRPTWRPCRLRRLRPPTAPSASARRPSWRRAAVRPSVPVRRVRCAGHGAQLEALPAVPGGGAVCEPHFPVERQRRAEPGARQRAAGGQRVPAARGHQRRLPLRPATHGERQQERAAAWLPRASRAARPGRLSHVLLLRPGRGELGRRGRRRTQQCLHRRAAGALDHS